MKNTIEVEQKFRVNNPEDYLPQLTEFTFGLPTLEVDIYYQHPVKNYPETDEWLRIRNWDEIVYKGPKLDVNAKARPEFKWENVRQPELFLETLGFTRLLEVHKRRRTGKLSLCKDGQSYQITITLDNLKDLGNFIEIEIVTEKNNVQFAVSQIEELAKKLGLENQELKGYAQLLLEKKCQTQKN